MLIGRKYHPQLRIEGLFLPDALCPLKMPGTTKFLMAIILNMAARHINLFESFTMKEIADSLAIAYTSVARGKKWLVENGFVDKKGEVLWNG